MNTPKSNIYSCTNLKKLKVFNPQNIIRQVVWALGCEGQKLPPELLFQISLYAMARILFWGTGQDSIFYISYFKTLKGCYNDVYNI